MFMLSLSNTASCKPIDWQWWAASFHVVLSATDLQMYIQGDGPKSMGNLYDFNLIVSSF